MTYKNLFLDANYLCAITNKNDSLHEKSVKVSKKFINSPALTSNFVLLESYTIISQRVGRESAIKFKERVYSQTEMKIINITPQIEKETWKVFKEIKNKNVSYVDCSIMALAKRGDVDTLLTFDSHFSKYQKKYSFSLLNQ